ncbi:MAG: hypothetical protein ISP49_17055 [Reyranella sp.]|nr:hypothetical protein [Reyranella sp.]MBL6653308.1 hypothetical protein [Reyranella sp.]
MRLTVCALGFISMAALPSGSQAQDAFMQACMMTTPQKMCECISSKVPADKKQAAIEGMLKSNKAMEPGGNLLDPSNLTQEQMQGLDAVVIAQANCNP